MIEGEQDALNEKVRDNSYDIEIENMGLIVQDLRKSPHVSLCVRVVISFRQLNKFLLRSADGRAKTVETTLLLAVFTDCKRDNQQPRHDCQS